MVQTHIYIHLSVISLLHKSFFVDTLELSFFLFFLILSSELLAVLTDTRTHFFPLNNSGCTCFLIKSQNIFENP